MGIFPSGDPSAEQQISIGTDGSGDAALRMLRESVPEDSESFIWLSLDDPTKAEVSSVADVFHLDPLLVEDSTSLRQRAKLDYDGTNLFVLLKVLDWVDETSDVETGQVAIFLGAGYAISIRHSWTVSPDTVRDRLREHPDLVDVGPMSVFWAIADIIVDGYLVVGEAIQDDIEEIEQLVFSPRPADAATRIYRLNRENIEMRRAVRPLVSEAQRLVRDDMPNVPKPLRPFLHDVGDHLLRANDMVDGFDSTLMTMLMASTARQDLMQNRDMRKISAWAAIIAVPTAMAGIYGMNFDFMPELHWQYGYPAILLLMLTICVLLYRGFKKSGWL